MLKMTGWRRRVMGRVVPLTMVLFAAACDSTTAPQSDDTLDTRAALQDYQALERVFASEGWAGFTALSGRTPLSSRAAMSAIGALPNATRTGSARQFALEVLRDAATAPGGDVAAASVPIVSDTIRGRTFTYDPTADRYVVNPTRSGAPANGVRFIMYAVDAADKPIVTQEIGYADLRDEGSANGNDVALRLVAVERGKTMLDYRTSLEGRDGSGHLEVTGYAVEGTNTLTFSISADGENVGGNTELDVSFDLRLEPRGFHIEGTLSGVDDSTDGAGTVELVVHHREQTLRVDMNSDGQSIEGEISFNGNTYVTLTGDAKNPTMRGAGGDPITGEELLVVLAVVDIADDVFDLIEDLVQPVDNLIALGWVL
jgi:hypothetical protein